MAPDTPERNRYLPPESELSERFVTAGGPGGQHVNKTATAVQLRYDVTASDFLSDPAKQRLLKLAGQRADQAGVITVEVRSHRSQHRNRTEARTRLAELVEQAHHVPKKRVSTRPPRAARRKRLENKRRRSRIKNLRGKPGRDA